MTVLELYSPLSEVSSSVVPETAPLFLSLPVVQYVVQPQCTHQALSLINLHPDLQGRAEKNNDLLMNQYNINNNTCPFLNK